MLMDNTEALKKLRELQLAQMELVRVFLDICEKEHLTYFAVGGTMLGAVRHKGFIPWDDDVDFGMPRSEHDKFLKVAGKYLPDWCHLLNDKTTKGYLYYITRLTSSRAKVRCSLYKEERIEDVSIDVFPLDGMPSTKLGQYVHEFKILGVHALYKFSVFDEYVSVSNPHRTWYEKILCFLCDKLSLQKYFSPRKRLDARDRMSRKYSYEDSEYITNLMGAYKLREMFPKSVFGEGVLYDFEGLKINGPQNYGTYLTQMYGDYMTPPKKLEIGKHNFEIVKSAET